MCCNSQSNIRYVIIIFVNASSRRIMSLSTLVRALNDVVGSIKVSFVHLRWSNDVSWRNSHFWSEVTKHEIRLTRMLLRGNSFISWTCRSFSSKSLIKGTSSCRLTSNDSIVFDLSLLEKSLLNPVEMLLITFLLSLEQYDAYVSCRY